MLRKIREYRYILVVIHDFRQFGCTVHLKKNKNALRSEESSETILLSSKRKPKVIETDDGKQIVQSSC